MRQQTELGSTVTFEALSSGSAERIFDAETVAGLARQHERTELETAKAVERIFATQRTYGTGAVIGALTGGTTTTSVVMPAAGVDPTGTLRTIRVDADGYVAHRPNPGAGYLFIALLLLIIGIVLGWRR